MAPRTLRRPLQSAGGPAGAFANQNIAAWLTSASVLSIGPETPRATEAVPCCGVCPLTRLPNVFHYKPAFAFLSHPLRNPSFLLSLFFFLLSFQSDARSVRTRRVNPETALLLLSSQWRKIKSQGGKHPPRARVSSRSVKRTGVGVDGNRTHRRCRSCET